MKHRNKSWHERNMARKKRRQAVRMQHLEMRKLKTDKSKQMQSEFNSKQGKENDQIQAVSRLQRYWLNIKDFIIKIFKKNEYNN